MSKLSWQKYYARSENKVLKEELKAESVTGMNAITYQDITQIGLVYFCPFGGTGPSDILY